MRNTMKGLLGMVCVCATVTAQTTFPLRVDIDVSAKKASKMVGAGDSGSVKRNSVMCKVKIRKSSGQAYTAPLKAELYIIGKQKQTGYFGIIDVVKEEFNFTKENGQEYRFESKEYSALSTYGNVEAGGTYETYLLIVLDENGEIIDYRAGRAIGEEGVAIIREMGPKTLFDRDGNVVGKVSKGDNRDVMKVAIPAAVINDRNN